MSLTPTEERIAGLVALGHRNAEVAAELRLSPKTVEWHLSRLYRKLGVRSRTELSVVLLREIPWAPTARKMSRTADGGPARRCQVPRRNLEAKREGNRDQ